MSRKVTSSELRSSNFANVPVNVELRANGTLQINYDLTMAGNRTINYDYEYSNGESYSSMYQEIYNYSFKESFTNISINTGINATTQATNIIGERYTIGLETITEESGKVKEIVHNGGPVSCYIENLTTRITGKK